MARKCLYCGCTYSDHLSSCPNCGGALTAENYHRETEDEEVGTMEIMGDKLRELFEDKRVLAVLLAVALFLSGASVSRRIARHKDSPPISQGQNGLAVSSTAGDSQAEPTAEEGKAIGVQPEKPVNATVPTDRYYELGMAYLEHGDYEKAIRTLNQVSSTSKEYTDAQLALLLASDAYRSETLQKAEDYNNSGDYASSIKLLRTAEDLTGFSAEVVMQREAAEELYFNTAMDQCKEAYRTDGAERAAVIANGALTILKEDARLLKLKQLFESVTTVSAQQVSHNYSTYAISTDDYAVDSYGNEHSGELLHFSTYPSGASGNVEYTPYEKFNTFSAKIFVGKMYEQQRAQLQFYCDGKLVYDTGMVDRQYRGETINIDITGVYSFRIVSDGYWTSALGSYDPNIWLEYPTFSTGITEADIDEAIQ